MSVESPRYVRFYEKGGGYLPQGKPRRERLEPVLNDESTPITNKPTGGLWTSPIDAEYGWDQWCLDNEAHWLGRCWKLRIVGEPKLAFVDSRAAMNRLALQYPFERPFGGFTHRGINFEQLADDFDGLWLTTQGHFATRLLDPDEPNTYAWDCETVLWFRWCFDQVREERVRVDG